MPLATLLSAIRSSSKPHVAGVYVSNESSLGDGDPLDVLNPSTGSLLTRMPGASLHNVDQAVRAASAAAGAWSALAPVERSRALARCAAAITEARDELAELAIADAGLPRSLALRDVQVASRYFEYYAGLADKIHGETIPLAGEYLDYTIREPWGVCAIVLPFNFPLQLAARDIAPALAVGNVVVAKPAEQAPLLPLALARLCWKAGLPPGVLNLVVGDSAIGAAVVEHPLIDHVTFTGSQATGRRVMLSCAQSLKPSTIELGGKSPHILFDDGSVQNAVSSIVGTTFRSAGQACSAGSRLLVHRRLRSDAVAALADAVSSLTVGPAATDPDVGPLITARQQSSVLDAVAAGVTEGASVVIGGGVPRDLRQGFFVEPTILDGVSASSAVSRQELFGPVIAVLSFDDEAEAIELANDTEFGLVAGVWTSDLGRAHRVARELRVGQVFVNNYGVGGGVELPFGGYKRSGIGRVKGWVGAIEYTQVKNVCVAIQ